MPCADNLRVVYANDDCTNVWRSKVHFYALIEKKDSEFKPDTWEEIEPMTWSDGDKEFQDNLDCGNFLGLEFMDFENATLKNWSKELAEMKIKQESKKDLLNKKEGEVID